MSSRDKEDSKEFSSSLNPGLSLQRVVEGLEGIWERFFLFTQRRLESGMHWGGGRDSHNIEEILDYHLNHRDREDNRPNAGKQE